MKTPSNTAPGHLTFIGKHPLGMRSGYAFDGGISWWQCADCDTPYPQLGDSAPITCNGENIEHCPFCAPLPDADTPQHLRHTDRPIHEHR